MRVFRLFHYRVIPPVILWPPLGSTSIYYNHNNYNDRYQYVNSSFYTIKMISIFSPQFVSVTPGHIKPVKHFPSSSRRNLHFAEKFSTEKKEKVH